MKLYEAMQLKEKEMICFVGAGGKTGLMQRLFGECAQQGRRVLVTTSTKMYRSQLTECCRLILEEDEERLRKKLIDASAGEMFLAAGKGLTAGDKVIGLSREFIDRLYISGLFDYILVEADGAKGRALKAPASFEPQAPERATCALVVSGIDALGRPLTEEYVHRCPIAAQLSEQEPGTPITAATMLSIFRYYRLILNQLSAEMRIIAVLNKADGEEEMHRAEEVARVLLPEMGRALITSTLLEEPVWEAEL